VAHLLPQLAAITKATAATTNDQDAQSKTLEQSKQLADRILILTQAAQAARSNPSKETYNEIPVRADDASQAIGSLVASLASGVNLMNDINDAVERINKVATTFDATPPVPPRTADGDTKGYPELKDELIELSKELALMLRNVVALDKGNLVQD